MLLALELVTGSFALTPAPVVRRARRTLAQFVANWGWVFAANLFGSVLYAPCCDHGDQYGDRRPPPVAARLISIAEAKTTGYAALGLAGMVTVFVKAILCNWMVCLAVVLAMASTSTIGKIATAWLPIFIFFAQGFEHAVVNMFVIPIGIMLGAHVTVADWWMWNQVPVTLGNIVGGFLFTGLALYSTYRPQRSLEMPVPAVSHQLPAE